MKSLALFLVLTSSCAAPLCVTKAGLRFNGGYNNYEVPESWSCSAIQEVESGMVSRLPQLNSSNLASYQLTIIDPSTKTDPWGRKVAGYTRCSMGEMVVWGYPAHPALSALSHEIAHALQNCTAKLPIDPGKDEDHADWTREGIDAAIEATMGARSP